MRISRRAWIKRGLGSSCQFPLMFSLLGVAVGCSANAGGGRAPIVAGATLVDALIWLWRGYPIE